ncbi:aspartyl/asparaginyl beta-hydroxylase domain-containing protein [Aurantimonas sp. VKM B-3413]|uniref:aspartyl/asparaginyl beta-hydroxylase domain-containing protein n=1 Tax=Aurantimonas sp. VKM B-3413 TaxID=2779401 RepID=UPI001E4F01AF|nr:aspartyl/asparaginyl beta-hydroxylase domain-containing protein [Aurantimonas sp. VKM B-3413]MCB8836867.1 aspartyl/asparaginyl beta-hydroxylase domain-containing protein [Aurantimonas sp. VKM B-3413]
MTRNQKKTIRRFAIAVPLVILGFWLIPVIAGIWIVCGLIDILRNKGRTGLMFSRYFMGNGIPTWLLSPFNLFVDLISHRNPGVWRPEDFPPEWRAEIDTVLDTFRARKGEIIADIDSQFAEGRRGMYVYQWYGKRFVDNVPEFNRDFKYVKTIAVSVFSGKESTTWHFGPLRLTLRVLLNLTPADSDRVFIECNGRQHMWRDDPLYIFDDTLFHRSVNEVDARRYNVFMDVIRPSPVPGVLSTLLIGVSAVADKLKAAFYKNWKMIDRRGETAKTPA